jgi:hypothetical protein
MSETAARLAIQGVIADIVEAHTAYPLVVEMDNRVVVDQSKQINPYLKVMIDFLTAGQADLSDNPLKQSLGQIVIHVVVKAGTGSVAGSTLRDLICPYFDAKVMGPVHCHMAERQRTQAIAGWDYAPILINFWMHTRGA